MRCMVAMKAKNDVLLLKQFSQIHTINNIFHTFKLLYSHIHMLRYLDANDEKREEN